MKLKALHITATVCTVCCDLHRSKVSLVLLTKGQGYLAFWVKFQNKPKMHYDLYR